MSFFKILWNPKLGMLILNKPYTLIQSQGALSATNL